MAKSFQNVFYLGKYRAAKSQIRVILYNNKIINKFRKINNSLYNFYQIRFSPNNDCLDIFAIEVLSKLNIPNLSFEEVKLCKGILTKDEIFGTSMKNNNQEMINFLRNSIKISGVV